MYIVTKFISTLLKEISNILRPGASRDQEHRDYIKEIVHLYYTNLHVIGDGLHLPEPENPITDVDEQKMLFSFLRDYSDYKINYKDLTDALRQAFTDRLFSAEIGSSLALAYIIGFLIRIYFCLSRKSGMKYLCVIDNIETFVRHDQKHPLLECELETIVNGCLEAIRSARQLLVPLQKIPEYYTFYGFLIVTRETTVSTALFDLSHDIDYARETEIDITNWFCSEEIYHNKKDFLIKKGMDFDMTCYDVAYSNVLNDHFEYRWALNGIISKMYKHSHRRSVECLPEALAVIPKGEIEYFNKQWKRALNDNNCDGLRTLGRKYILRLLLDHINRKGYFDRLMVATTPTDFHERSLNNPNSEATLSSSQSDSTSFARKISTILHRVALRSPGGYTSFPRLIKSILKSPYLPNEPTSTQIENLGKIIFLMNETRNQDTNWTSLVCLKYSNKRVYSEPNLCETLKEEWDNYQQDNSLIDDISEFGIRITVAGSFFAKVLPDFEYFACRFLPREPALFSLENIKSLDINSERTYRAVEIIRTVKTHAFNCVEDVINKDVNFFAALGEGNSTAQDFSPMLHDEYGWTYQESRTDTPHTHPYRVLSHHRGYISNYSHYVDKFVPLEAFDEVSDKKKMLSLIKRELREYDDKLTTLQGKYPNYFGAHRKKV